MQRCFFLAEQLNSFCNVTVVSTHLGKDYNIKAESWLADADN